MEIYWVNGQKMKIQNKRSMKYAFLLCCFMYNKLGLSRQLIIDKKLISGYVSNSNIMGIKRNYCDGNKNNEQYKHD